MAVDQQFQVQIPLVPFQVKCFFTLLPLGDQPLAER